MKTISAAELAQWLASQPESAPVVLDVRERWELEQARLPQCLHIPMGDIPNRLNEIPESRPVVCLCHHGIRSYQVGLYLEKNGVNDVYNLHGGIAAWSAQVDPSCPTY